MSAGMVAPPSTVSVSAFMPIQLPEKRDMAQALRP
jgi:hypothetical protein